MNGRSKASVTPIPAEPVTEESTAPAEDPHAALKKELANASADQLADAMFSRMEKLADALAGVTDVASARKAKPEVRKVTGELDAIKELSQGVDDSLTKEQRAELQKKYEPRMQAIMQKLMPAMVRIGSDEAIQKELGDVLDL